MNFKDLPEVDCAARWWADHVGSKKQNNGDGMQSIMVFMLGEVKPLNDEEKIDFVKEFKAGLQDKWTISNVSWNIEDPIRGSYFRTIGVDYQPDHILTRALNSIGHQVQIRSFPMKTVMWINPGSVEVALGYKAKPVEIFNKE